MITDHEQAGHWSEALACYDMALQVSPNQTSLRIGIFACLRNLGHFDTMAALVQGKQAHLHSYTFRLYVLTLLLQDRWQHQTSTTTMHLPILTHSECRPHGVSQTGRSLKVISMPYPILFSLLSFRSSDLNLKCLLYHSIFVLLSDRKY